MANIQLQIQNLVKLVNVTNIQLADIETILLQTEEMYKEQIEGDIYSISEKLKNIIYRDMECQAHCIHVLLTDKSYHNTS